MCLEEFEVANFFLIGLLYLGRHHINTELKSWSLGLESLTLPKLSS